MINFISGLIIGGLIGVGIMCIFQINRLNELKEKNDELKLIVGLRQKRNLISKFDKEYDEEDKKKNPNRDYVAVTPDAEEVYKRYYELKNRINRAIEYIGNKNIGVPRKTREKAIKILGGDVDDE